MKTISVDKGPVTFDTVTEVDITEHCKSGGGSYIFEQEGTTEPVAICRILVRHL